MKTIIAVVVIVIVMWLLVQYRESETSAYEYVKEQTTEVVQNNPENPDSWKLELLKDEDAVKAAQAVIRKKELEAELKEVDTQIKELQERRKSVTSELTTY